MSRRDLLGPRPVHELELAAEIVPVVLERPEQVVSQVMQALAQLLALLDFGGVDTAPP